MKKLFVLLFLNITILCGTAQTIQVIDSATRSINMLSPDVNIKKWWKDMNSWSEKVDSVQRKISWTKPATDTLLIDSTLVFLTNAKTHLRTLANTVKDARVAEELYLKNAKETDTALLVPLLAEDSLRSQPKAVLDSLRNLEMVVNKLVKEIDLLQESTVQQRVQIVALDSLPSDMSANSDQVFRTIEKNWSKDGASTSYFAVPTWSNRVLILLISFLYFYWIYRLGRKTSENTDEPALYKNEPLWIPILKALLLFLILLPLGSLVVPLFILQLSYLIVFLILFVILFKELEASKRKFILLIFVYYIGILLANLMLSDSSWSKILVIIANIVGIYLLWRIGQEAKREIFKGVFLRYAYVVIAIAHLLAIVLLLFSYVNMGRMWSMVAAVGMLQWLSLRSVRDMLLHDLEKQYEVSKEESWFKRFDLKEMLVTADLLIRFCSAALILLVLLNGLQLTKEASTISDHIFNTNHKLGSISFTYGNLLLALVVMAMANWFQKTLKKITDIPNASEKHMRKMTLFPLFRMVIIVIGFLIALSILGLGLDRLTVIIGALGVGIGLGLQSIINNFVSGIILVFEKPFKIGDYVELADKKGQVMEIGIRSSTLLTDQGARVIIPNGDLLSGRLVNWTFSDSDIRLNMQLDVEKTVDLEGWKSWLRTTIASCDEVDKTIPVKIWTKGMTMDSYQVSIQVGIRNVQLIEKFRSHFLELVQRDMAFKNIKVSSS